MVSQSGQRQDLSLIELFQNWQTWREVVAENPPTSFALYRILISILHCAYQGPEDEAHWQEMQDDDGKRAITYLKQYADCFDLCNLERPFMQAPDLTQGAGAEIYQAHSLHGNNTSTVFCHEHQWSKSSLSLAEAARLVVRLHQFDVGGRKTGATVSAGIIPTMDAANVLVRGQTLKETLMLNLVQYDGEDEPFPTNGTDRPTWEHPSQPPMARLPTGYIDYLTFQWRRVKLFFADDRAIKVAFQGGDSLPKTASSSDRECAIAYRETKQGLRPIRLDLNRSLWRDSAAFLQTAGVYRRPKLIDWLSELSAAGLIDEYLNLQIMGLSVDNAKPLGWLNAQFSAPVVYLTQKDFRDTMSRAIEIAEEHQQVFRSFKGSPYAVLAEALKHPHASNLAQSLDGESRYWAALDREFLRLLQVIPEQGTQAITAWQSTVQKVALDAFTDSIAAVHAYHARARSLQMLHYYLAKFRSEIKAKEKKGKKKQQEKTAVSAGD